jgi:hypothetical protein
MRIAKPALALAAAVGFVAINAGAQDAPSAALKKPSPPHTRFQAKPAPGSPDFGLNQTHYVRIGATEFAPDGDNVSYSSTFLPESADYQYLRFYTGNGYSHFLAWVHAPGGSSFNYAELDACNTDATHDLVMNVYSCDFMGACSSTPLATVTATANSGCLGFTTSVPATTVNNFVSEYLLDVAWPAIGPNDSTIGLAGAIIGWNYQISPAPAMATFPDVPTSDPGFQYVEALVASGITAGCGGGNYCPDNSLTRRQMAVFLSKALGLYWGGY